MEKLKKCFGGIKMTWPKVIIFAVLSGVVTAVLNLIPALKGTSFQDIAISFECWILFAVFIIVNCEKVFEAMLKCFVYFLISQPLIYLIEVPFVKEGWGIFSYYKYWGLITVLTLPGAAVAFLLKKKNWLSVLSLSVANGFLGYMCIKYFRSASTNFPYHIVSSVFCLVLAVVFIFALLDEKKHRLAAAAVVLAVMAATFIYTAQGSSYTVELGEGTWSVNIEDESIAGAEMIDADTAKITPQKNGTTYVMFRNDKGVDKLYLATVSGGQVYVNIID